MIAILVAYASNHGNTRRMAEALGAGARRHEGATVVVKAAPDITEADMEGADGIALGSPVQMSNLNWEVKRLIDDVVGPLWMRDALVGKAGAAFATGGGYGSAGAGCEQVMVSILGAMAESGMVLLPLPKTTPGYAEGGLQWGPYARSAGPHMEQTGIEEAMLVAVEHHGLHLAQLAAALSGARVFDG